MRHKHTLFALLAFFLILALASAIFLLVKPIITGNAVQEQQQETVYTDKVSMVVNESGSYKWSPQEPGSLKSLKASGSISTNGSARVYIEKNGVKYVLFDSTRQLFDIDIHVLPEYKKIYSGDEVLIQITIFNLRGFGSGNVTVRYSVKDSNGNLIALDEESVYIETQAKFVRKLLIPSDIQPGTYFAVVEVYSKSLLGSGSDTFELKPKFQLRQYSMVGIIIAIASFAAIAVIVFMIIVSYRSYKRKDIIIEIKKKGESTEKIRLKEERESLEKAYKSKFISEESYKRRKVKIEKELKKNKS